MTVAQNPVAVNHQTGALTWPTVVDQAFSVREGGTAATMGTLTLNGTTPVVVSTTAVTANSRIFLCNNSGAGTPALAARVSARTPGTSFSVVGTALDTSVYAWLLVEPGT